MINTGIARKLGLNKVVDYLTYSFLDLKKKATHFYRIKLLKKKKVFCIGRNKTGTTSLKKAFEDLGYIVGNQREAELLSSDYFKNDFSNIIEYCKKSEVFQDIPFSYPETYKVLDITFPGSKFVLSIRDNPEQWYKSVTTYHSKLFGRGQVPTADDLKNATYVYEGWMWYNISNLYKTTEQDPYHKETLIQHYIKYNHDVQEYFKGRDNDLLVINLSEEDAYNKFCSFLKVKSPFKDFPWANKTENIKVKK